MVNNHLSQNNDVIDYNYINVFIILIIKNNTEIDI